MDAFARFEDWLDTFDEPAPPPPRLGPGAQAFVLPFSTQDPMSENASTHDGWHLFEHAFAWVPEADAPAQVPPPAPIMPPPPPAIEIEAIASELALSVDAPIDELQRARRRFMWENHPDRRTDLAPETANRRVAIANMLIDRALKSAAKRAGSNQP